MLFDVVDRGRFLVSFSASGDNKVEAVGDAVLHQHGQCKVDAVELPIVVADTERAGQPLLLVRELKATLPADQLLDGTEDDRRQLLSRPVPRSPPPVIRVRYGFSVFSGL